MRHHLGGLALAILGTSLAYAAAATFVPAVAAEPAPPVAQKPTLVANGTFVAPQFSSDGTKLLVTGGRMHGIGEVEIASGTIRWHLDEARVGVHARYLGDGNIGFRARRAGRLRELTLAPNGHVTQSTEAPPRVFAHLDAIYHRSAARTIRVSTGGRFFTPLLSPDGTKIAYTGLATGVHVYNIAKKTQTRIGSGTAPTWSPDSGALAFERTEDDGHNIVGSELWVWTEARGTQALTRSDALIERRPSWSPDGQTLAFDNDNGSVFTLAVGAPR